MSVEFAYIHSHFGVSSQSGAGKNRTRTPFYKQPHSYHIIVVPDALRLVVRASLWAVNLPQTMPLTTPSPHYPVDLDLRVVRGSIGAVGNTSTGIADRLSL